MTHRKPPYVPRPLFYGYYVNGKTIAAYTREEWGIGAGSGGASYNLIRSFYFSIFLTILFAGASLAALAFGVFGLFRGFPMALFMLFFGALFGFGVVQVFFNVRQEWRGRQARKLKGLRKPWFTASDNAAYQWFVRHPSQDVPMTLEYFPDAVKFRDEARQSSL
ncbi:hypothetical protein [Arthrobacter globiformis]|uniref:hypothetical protein n=1 Tax=Arthrobacter globiformis TaxID=1665 RepID=UPI0027D87B0B|nr:hypothetical protein [Arthrobacter globiformis]